MPKYVKFNLYITSSTLIRNETIWYEDNFEKSSVTFFFVSTYALSRDSFIFRMSRALRLIHIMTHSFAWL